MSAEDWTRDEQRVRSRRCECREGSIGHDPGERCARQATWSTADVPGLEWLCDECCERILMSSDIEVEAVDP